MFNQHFAILAVLCTWLLVSEHSQAEPKAHVKHPNLLLNREEIEQIKEKIRKYEWAAGLFERVKALADDRERTGNNPREAALMYALTGDKAYAADVRRELVGRSRRLLREYEKLDIQQDPDFGAWGPYPTWAWAYDLTYDTFSDEEREIVERLFRTAGRSIIEGMKVRTTSIDLVFGKHFEVALLGYCLGDRELIDWGMNDPGFHGPAFGGFFQVLDTNIRDKYFWSEAPRYALGRTLQGMMAVAEAAQHFDGTDLYHYTSKKSGASIKGLVDGYLRLAYPMEKTGIRGGSIRMATFGDASTSYTPAGELVDTFLFNPIQGGAKSALNMQGEMELAYKHYKNPSYAWFISLQPERDAYLDNSLRGRSGKIWGYVALTHGDPLPENLQPPAAPSGIYPSQGLAVLRSDESPRYWDSGGTTAILRLGSAIGHGHKDYFHLILHGKGRLLYPDLQLITYEPALLNWTSEGVAHNTLLVDHQSPRPGQFMTRQQFSPEAKFFAITGSAFDDVRQMRALLLTPEYLADVLHAADTQGRTRTFDWVQHGLGRIYPGNPAAYRQSDGLVPHFWWVDNERSRKVDQTWQVDWIQKSGGVQPGLQAFSKEWYEQTIGVRLTMAGARETEVFVADGPMTDGPPNHRLDGNPEGSVPLVVVRRKAAATTFAAVHEPYDKRPIVKRVKRIDETEEAVGLAVESDAFSDRVLVAHEAEKRHTLRSADGEAFTFRDHGYVRVTSGGAIAQGQIERIRVRATEATPLEVTINGAKQTARRNGDFIEFGEIGDGRAPKAIAEVSSETKASIHPFFMPEEIHLRSGGEKAATLHLRCVGQGEVHGKLRLIAPQGIGVEPGVVDVHMREGDEKEVQLSVRAEASAAPPIHAVEVKPVGDTSAAPSSLLVSVGVVITKDNRIPFCAQSVIRAPGYTMRLDHESGVSCYLLDADGHRRHGATYESVHGRLGFGAVMRDNQWIFRYRMPCRFIFDGPNKLIAVNETGKDQVRLTYTFEEDQIRFGLTPPTDKERECTVWFGPFDALGESGKDKAGKGKSKNEEGKPSDQFFFRHPVHRQGLLVVPSRKSSVHFRGDAFSVQMRTGDEVLLRFAEANE